jgi:hypothetical protein
MITRDRPVPSAARLRPCGSSFFSNPGCADADDTSVIAKKNTNEQRAIRDVRMSSLQQRVCRRAVINRFSARNQSQSEIEERVETAQHARGVLEQKRHCSREK